MLLRGFILTLFLLSIKPCLLAQEGGTKYIIYPAVGDVIDSAEAKRCQIFTQYEGFDKAVFYKLTDTTFYAELQYKKNDSLISIKRSYKQNQIDELTEKIEFVTLGGQVSQFQQNIRRPLNTSEYGYRSLYYPRASLGAGISLNYINFNNIKDAFTRIEDIIIQRILDNGKQNVYKFVRGDKDFSTGPLIHANIRYMFSPYFEISTSMMWGLGETQYYSTQIWCNVKFPKIINLGLIPFAGVGVAGMRIDIVKKYNQPYTQYHELKEISFRARGILASLNAGISVKLSQYFNTHFNILYPFHTSLQQSSSYGDDLYGDKIEFNLNTLEAGLIFSFDF